jgi:hypothetical protein
VEDRTEETVSYRYRSQTISMAETETLSGNLHQRRLLETDHSEFLEIRIAPDIVISLEEIHLHTPIHQLTESGEHLDISLRDHIAVFIPEIPDVTKKVQCFRLISRYLPEERDETGFTTGRIRYLQTEMYVRDEICQISWFHIDQTPRLGLRPRSKNRIYAKINIDRAAMTQ